MCMCVCVCVCVCVYVCVNEWMHDIHAGVVNMQTETDNFSFFLLFFFAGVVNVQTETDITKRMINMGVMRNLYQVCV